MKSAVLITLLSVAGPVLADAAGGSIETVLVSAAREPIELKALGSSVTVLDEAFLENRQSASLGEILRSVPGLAVSRVGGMGSQTQVRTRGGEANHTLVFIDGIRVNDPAQNSEFNMAHVLNYDIESVEVIRGPQSALWGSDALAGVINVKTRRPGQGFGGDVFAEGGSDAWQNYGATASYSDQRLSAIASGNVLETDGDNISRQGGEKDGYDNQTLTFGASYQLTDGLRLATDLRYVDARNDFDATDFSTGLPADSNNRSDVEQLYGRVAADLELLEGRWSHHLSYSLANTNNENRSENAFAATGFDVTRADADVAIATYQTRFTVRQGHRLIAAFERQEQDFKQRGPVDFGDPNRDENLDADSFVLEYRGELTDAVSVLASARHDDNSDFDDKTTGRVSAAWRLNSGATKLRAAYGSGIKNPTFTERFGYYNDFIGNPDLKPEKSSGWEAGIDQQLLEDRLRFSLTWFEEELEDEINGFVYDPASGGFTAANDNGTSHREGLEFNGSWLLRDNLSLSFAYTWLDATGDDSLGGGDSDEIRRPEHVANANLNWSFFSGAANLNLNIDYNGEQDDFFFPPVPPYQERVQLDEFTVLSLAGSYQLMAGLQLYARIENALDEDYEEVFGYVAPRRSVIAGLRYRFAR